MDSIRERAIWLVMSMIWSWKDTPSDDMYSVLALLTIREQTPVIAYARDHLSDVIDEIRARWDWLWLESTSF